MCKCPKQFLLLGISTVPLAQEMPYPVAYTYVAMAETGDGWSVTATSVANTNCTAGHTLPVVAVNVYNPGRTRSAFASNNYSPHCYGQATAYLPLCSDGQCEDGQFEAENEGTTEYCPSAVAFVAAVAAQASANVEAFKYLSRVWWDPAGPIARQDGEKGRSRLGLIVHPLRGPATYSGGDSRWGTDYPGDYGRMSRERCGRCAVPWMRP